MTDIRLASQRDADQLAQLLHNFNEEFETPTPGAEILARRLRSLLAGSSTFAVLADSPPVGFAIVTFRPNVWFDGPVAIVDELYVEPRSRGRGIGAQIMARVERECRTHSADYVEINVDEGDTDARRFYERLGYSGTDPDTGEPAMYYSRYLSLPPA
jgi:GNAT superfamily N-acetyltransferase